MSNYVSLIVKPKELSIIALSLTEYATLCVFNGFRDPITKRQIDVEILLDIAIIVQKINDALGNPVDENFNALIRTLKEQARKET